MKLVFRKIRQILVLILFYNICILIVTTASTAFDRNFPFCDSFKLPSWYWIPSLRKFSGWVAGQEYLKVRNCNEVQLDHRKGVDENRKLIGDFITPLGLLKVSHFGLSNLIAAISWLSPMSPMSYFCACFNVSISTLPKEPLVLTQRKKHKKNKQPSERSWAKNMEKTVRWSSGRNIL